MSRITFLPMNQVFETKPGETILEVALRNDVPIRHACGGYCACTTCQVKVVSGADQLSPMEEEEQDRLEAVGEPGDHSRLGCQSRIRGDVTVEVINLD